MAISLANAKISTLKIRITIEAEGQTFEGEIDNENYLCPPLIEAIRRGKNPVDALEFLAEHGAKNLGTEHFQNTIGQANRLGRICHN